ncbi:hypothetical protein, partial [Pseudomonas sp. O39]|uniref:hypothetical protein n=1 Tax=Pseudomonas sp. O39 TaxID=3379130 RepID=UPI00387B2C8B
MMEWLATKLVMPRLELHAEVVKPLLVGSTATPIKTVPVASLKAGDQLVSNAVPAVRKKTQQTALVRQEHVDDVP